MRILLAFSLSLSALVAQTAPADEPKAAAKPKGGVSPKLVPFPQRETLRYSVNWESGLSLGDAQLNAAPAAIGDSPGWEFTFQVQAAVPKFPIAEFARSLSTANFCTVESEKKAIRGKRKTDEKTTIEPRMLKAVRQTLNGGRSEVAVSPCAKDALAFLYYLRRELAQGRLPQPQTALYGAPYEIAVKYLGTQKLKLGGEETDAERIGIDIKGPVVKQNIEVLFLKDGVRTPAKVRVILPVGAITMDLTR
jgi:hypothetical protein